MPATAEKATRGRPREEDSYAAASIAANCSPSHAYHVIKLGRPASPSTITKIKKWAQERKEVSQGNSEAVNLALAL